MKNLTCIFLSGALMVFSACADRSNTAELYNNKASFPASFDFDKMGLKVMTSFINKGQATMGTLYANVPAIKNATAGNKEPSGGEVFALVTWKQQSDDHWFGAKIPADLQSVELLKTNTKGTASYQNFEGKNLVLSTDTAQNQFRIKYILALQPAVMP